jgi:F-type H+-transporting ATPase subunit epsilon
MSEKPFSGFRLKIVTSRRLLAETEADEVFIPTLEGQIGVLPGHRPLYTAVGRGILTFKSGGSEESFSILGGFAEIGPEEVVVVTELAENAPNPSADGRG